MRCFLQAPDGKSAPGCHLSCYHSPNKLTWQGGIGGEQPLRCSIVPGGMYGGNGGHFYVGKPSRARETRAIPQMSTRVKMPSLQICRPESRKGSGKSVKGVARRQTLWVCRSGLWAGLPTAQIEDLRRGTVWRGKWVPRQLPFARRVNGNYCRTRDDSIPAFRRRSPRRRRRTGRTALRSPLR